MKEDNPEGAEVQSLENQIAEDVRMLNELGIFGESRRQFLKQIYGASLAVAALQLLSEQIVFAAGEPGAAALALSTDVNPVSVRLNVNSVARSLKVDSRMTLLDALRERLELTGSKKGCDHGQCGACTVLIDGQRVLSCLTLTAQCEGKSVTTIEGLAEDGQLHPLQTAFIKHDGFQCGYCTPGQICSAVALLNEAKNGDASYVTADVRAKAGAIQLSEDEIRERMSGNLCRCGAYPNIVAAIREVHGGKDVAQTWQFAGEKGGRI